MLINPSPTTPLAMRVSGRAAGRAGQGRAGRPLPPRICPAQLLQHSRARGRPSLGTRWLRRCRAVPKSALAQRPCPCCCVARASTRAAGVRASSLWGAVGLPRCRSEEPSPLLCPSGAAGGLCLCSCTGFVSQSREPAALQMCQLLWRRRLVSTGGA